MSTQTPQLDWREGRRRRAWELKQQGWKQQGIAAALGVTPGAVSQWLKRGREQGLEGLRRHPALGRQPRLTVEQLAQLPALLERSPEAYGFRGHVWTCKRVAEVIQRTWGVTYHPAHVSRLLHALRHSVQRPSRGRRSATNGRSRPGGRSAGQSWKKSGRRGAHHRLGRSIKVLLAAPGRAHRGAVWADAAAAGAPHPCSSGGHQWDHP